MPRKPEPSQASDTRRGAASDGASGRAPKLSTKKLRSRAPRPYDVGYAKPPADSQFKPGQSGNPGGRPKGRRTGQAPILDRMKAIVIEEAYRTIKVNQGARQISVSVAQAAIRSLAVNAAKGQPRAQKQFADLLRDVEAQNRADHLEWLQVVIEYKVGCEREIQLAKDQGRVPPDPVPHPEDIIIDFATNQVQFVGPMREEDKLIYHSAWRMIVEIGAELSESELKLERSRSEKSIRKLNEAIDFRRGVRDKLSAKFGEPPRRFREATDNAEDCDD